MTVEITGIKVTADKIEIDALNIESMLFADDLYEDVEVPTVRYEFDRKARGGAEMKYLYKVVESQRRCQAAKCMGEKLEKLVGALVQLSDNFRVKEAQA